jgi:hypothetical protein
MNIVCLSKEWLNTNIYFNLFYQLKFINNGKEATVNRALDSSMYPSKKLGHSVFGNTNYDGLKHNSLYLGLVLAELHYWNVKISFYLETSGSGSQNFNLHYFFNTRLN